VLEINSAITIKRTKAITPPTNIETINRPILATCRCN
jgi:hypothetical protein